MLVFGMQSGLSYRRHEAANIQRFSIEKKEWKQFQLRPKTITGDPITRSRFGASAVVPGLQKAFYISGTEVDTDVALKGMLVYDFESETWENKTTAWTAWERGLVNHVPVGDGPGFLIGFAGSGREVGSHCYI